MLALGNQLARAVHPSVQFCASGLVARLILLRLARILRAPSVNAVIRPVSVCVCVSVEKHGDESAPVNELVDGVNGLAATIVVCFPFVCANANRFLKAITKMQLHCCPFGCLPASLIVSVASVDSTITIMIVLLRTDATVCRCSGEGEKEPLWPGTGYWCSILRRAPMGTGLAQQTIN